MFKRRGPTYTDYGSDAPRQRLRAKFWLVMAVAFVARSCGRSGYYPAHMSRSLHDALDETLGFIGRALDRIRARRWRRVRAAQRSRLPREHPGLTEEGQVARVRCIF
jgi:hypothetical protein